MKRERANPAWLTRALDGALWLLVFLLPVKFGGLIIIPDRPETFVDWQLGRWPLELAIGWALLWVALALLRSRRRKEADSLRADVRPPIHEPRGTGILPVVEPATRNTGKMPVARLLVHGRDAPTYCWWSSLHVGGYSLFAATVLLWLAAQWLAAAASPWPSRAVSVAIFFTATAVFFWIGFAGGADERYWRILGALTVGMVVVCGVALHQHFIGFPQTLRDASDAAGTLSPELRERLPDLMAKLRQGRVFGTLYYPNSLAGFLILVGPPACCWLWLFLRRRLEGGERLVRWTSAVAAVVLACMALWCLLLTESKGGFLMLALALVAGLIFCRPIPVRWRIGVLAALVMLGAVWFGAAGLRRGVETIEARGDYWRAGLAMIAEQPWLGSGPGTFGLRYVKHRQADAEWTRLAHNNYLQQWTDSGILGFASYAALWIAALWLGAQRLRREPFDWLTWATWVGLAAWVGHNLVDFDLYIAAIAWPSFLMAGWMLNRDSS